MDGIDLFHEYCQIYQCPRPAVSRILRRMGKEIDHLAADRGPVAASDIRRAVILTMQLADSKKQRAYVPSTICQSTRGLLLNYWDEACTWANLDFGESGAWISYGSHVDSGGSFQPPKKLVDTHDSTIVQTLHGIAEFTTKEK